MTQILAHVPLFVWGILLALVALGVSQSRPRAVALRRLVVLPVVMLGLGVAGVVGSFGHPALTLPVFAAAVTLSVLLLTGRMDVSGVGWDAATNRLSVPGSWLPLAMMMAIFALKFVVGATLALHPALRETASFTLPMSAAYGLLGGFFAARAIAWGRCVARDGRATRVAGA